MPLYGDMKHFYDVLTRVSQRRGARVCFVKAQRSHVPHEDDQEKQQIWGRGYGKQAKEFCNDTFSRLDGGVTRLLKMVAVTMAVDA